MSSSSLAIRLASGPRKSLARQLAANPPAVLDLTRPMTPKRYKFWTEFAKTHRIEMIEKDSTRQGAKTPAPPAKESVLRDLISLHHASASFMHSPEEARIGFENAFARTPEPKFEHYESWARGVIGSQGDNQLVNNDPTSFDPVTYDSGNPGEVYWQTFKKNDDLFSSSNNSTTLLTAREREVKEALFGTWERGGLGMEGSKPGLDGVMEYLKAKGETVASTAAEWESRNKIVSVSAPQEPEIPSIEAPQH